MAINIGFPIGGVGGGSGIVLSDTPDGDWSDATSFKIKVLGWGTLDFSGCVGLPGILIEESQITLLKGIPESVVRLDFTGSYITELEAFPSDLKVFTMNGGPWPTMPALPEGLTDYDIAYVEPPGALLPVLPDSLEFLGIFATNFTNWPAALPTSLKRVNWDISVDPSDGRNDVPELPDGMTFIRIQGLTGLAELPNVPPALVTLQLNYTGITDAPIVPSTIEYVDLRFCHLTTLAVDTLLILLDSFGTSNLYVDLSSQDPVAPRTSASDLAVSGIEGRSGTVIVDS